MMHRSLILSALATLGFWLAGALPVAAADTALFNVKDYGATGHRNQDARTAIQKAIDACAAAGGGTVYLPPGEYTSGQLKLKSHVRLHIEGGATLLASMDEKAYEKGHYAALISATDVENISIEGRGLVDGQSSYEYRLDDLDDAYIRPNMLLMKTLGKPLMRPFPAGFPTRETYPRMVLLIRCRDIRITGLSFMRSPSWTIHPVDCDRIVIDGIHVQSSLKEGVWADGIDPYNCKDVIIANSVIETGDDAIVFYSHEAYGAPRACENITITNCRLSSASSALKFCDGNLKAIRRVTIDNCVITDSNRGIAVMNFDGGIVEDVVISNVTIETRRFDWYWWGDSDPLHFNIKRRDEIDPRTPKEKVNPAGVIRNLVLRNIIARGKGTSIINGHPDSWLENVTLENVRLFISAEPGSPMEKADHAMKVRWARNFKMKDVAIHWDKPDSPKWQSALHVEDVQGMEIDGFEAGPVKPGTEVPVIVLKQAENVVIRNSKPRAGTGIFVQVEGEKSRDILLTGNDLRQARVATRLASGGRSQAIQMANNVGEATARARPGP